MRTDGKNEKTALEKSHSKGSNFLLTLLALLSAIAFAAVFTALFLIKKLTTPIFLLILIPAAVICILCVILFNFFKR